jgi:hypothetical protein
VNRAANKGEKMKLTVKGLREYLEENKAMDYAVVANETTCVMVSSFTKVSGKGYTLGYAEDVENVTDRKCFREMPYSFKVLCKKENPHDDDILCVECLDTGRYSSPALSDIEIIHNIQQVRIHVPLVHETCNETLKDGRSL